MAHSRVSSHSTGPQIQDNLLTRRLGVPWTPFLLQAELHDFSWITSSNCSDLQHSWDRAAQVFLCPPVGKKPHIKCFHISGCMMKGITGSGHMVSVRNCCSERITMFLQSPGTAPAPVTPSDCLALIFSGLLWAGIDLSIDIPRKIPLASPSIG